MATYFVPETDLAKLLGGSASSCTFAPVQTGGLAWLDLAEGQVSMAAISQPRAAQSPKGSFMPPAESVGKYGSSAQPIATEVQKSVVLGLRACELRAMNYLDQVMLEGEFEDPAYRRRREGSVLVSCDCPAVAETCFCTLVGGQPYPTQGFDVNLTPVGEGFIVEVATQKGQDWLGGLGSSPTEATAAQVAEREDIRQEATQTVQQQNAGFKLAADDLNAPALPNDGEAAWQQFAADCVECGACTNICPTCHCFYLYDQVLGQDQFERVRTWDSCLFSTYHRMAGGASMKLTPRPKLSSRLANRVLHKFTYSRQQYGLLGCVGCGRCIDACLGAIDIREVVDQLSK